LHTVIPHSSDIRDSDPYKNIPTSFMDLKLTCMVLVLYHKGSISTLTLRRQIRWFLQAVSQTLSFLRFPFLRLSIIGCKVICFLTSRWWRGLLYYWTHLPPVLLPVNCFLGYSLHLRQGNHCISWQLVSIHSAFYNLKRLNTGAYCSRGLHLKAVSRTQLIFQQRIALVIKVSYFCLPWLSWSIASRLPSTWSRWIYPLASGSPSPSKCFNHMTRTSHHQLVFL